jgi:hypothetical protein
VLDVVTMLTLLHASLPMQRIVHADVPQFRLMLLHAAAVPHEMRQTPASPHVTVAPQLPFAQFTLHCATPGGHVMLAPVPLMLHPPTQPPLHSAGHGPASTSGPASPPSGTEPSSLLPSLLPPLLVVPLDPPAPLDEVEPLLEALVPPSPSGPTSCRSPTAEIPHAAAMATKAVAVTMSRARDAMAVMLSRDKLLARWPVFSVRS